MLSSFTATELFEAIESDDDFVLLDVRNEDDYSNFSVEGPNEIEMLT
ncbi:MAG TPA: MBL fold metallo-hydrolase, partial [Candidatus Poseidoniales archaeon]|nr:MBL fold metallo-hydrolase [Candidatus Poseidoniales archaeon]